MAERVGTLIVGGGIAGCAFAHYLAQEGETDILLVEADELGSGSTGGSFGGVRQQFSTPLEIELSRRGLEFWRTAERVFDSPVPWHENGYLFMSGNADIVSKLAEAAELQRSMGLADIEVLDVEQIKELTPCSAPPIRRTTARSPQPTACRRSRRRPGVAACASASTGI